LLSSSAPRSIRYRASVEDLISLAGMMLVQFGLEVGGSESGRAGGFFGGGFGLLDDAQDVGFLHDQKVLAVNLDFGPRPFAEQDEVTSLDIERDQLTALVTRAWADGDHFAFLRFFLGGVGNDDPTFGFEFAF